MEARKGNKVYQVDKVSANEYAANGYDIYSGNKLVKHALGKSVPIADYEKALARIEELEAELGIKKKGGRQKKSELLAEAESLGIEVPEGATNPEIYELIEAAK